MWILFEDANTFELPFDDSFQFPLTNKSAEYTFLVSKSNPGNFYSQIVFNTEGDTGFVYYGIFKFKTYYLLKDSFYLLFFRKYFS